MKSAMILGVVLLLGLYASVMTVYAEEEKSAAYVSPEGIQFTSFSRQWNEERLKGLYEVLLRCKHGVELAELKEVILYPKSSTGKSGFRVGNYNSKTQTIRLFEVDSSQVDRTLIHEYGHHFTFYWLPKKEGFTPDLLTELSGWAKIRQLEGYPVRWYGSKLPYNHKWDPAEIMAEDYAALFGLGGVDLPAEAKDTVNLLRHENEYIPSAQSIPSLRRYWEEIAGLTPQKPLGVPVIEHIEAVGGKGEDSGAVHISFSPAAADGQQLIDYGVTAVGFGERVSLPVRWSSGASGSGNSSVEIQLDIQLFQGNPANYYNIQIWALDRENMQITYTPFYLNWFEYSVSTQQLRAVSPPMERYGWQEDLAREGMEQWPLIHIFVSGMPTTAVLRYRDEESNIYVAWRWLEKEEVLPGESTDRDAESPAVHPVWRMSAAFNQHQVDYWMDDESLMVDGVRTRLLKPIKWIGNEPFISVQDLPQLFGITAALDEAGTGLYIDPVS